MEIRIWNMNSVCSEQTETCIFIFISVFHFAKPPLYSQALLGRTWIIREKTDYIKMETTLGLKKEDH